MTLNARPRMDVVKREDKEARLKAFITSHLEAATQTDACEPWLLIARSAESPVIKALAALAPAIAAAGHRVNTLLLNGPAAIDTAEAATVAGETRFAADVRLLDAHEQLYLDRRTSWIGDCMRREPAKRDAYECFAANCTITADWSRKTFDRLWSKSHVARPAAHEPQEQDKQDPTIEGCPPQTAQGDSTLVVSTRH